MAPQQVKLAFRVAMPLGPKKLVTKN